jgi:hypothetical protein
MFKLMNRLLFVLLVCVTVVHAESTPEDSQKSDTNVKWINPDSATNNADKASPKSSTKVTRILHFQIYDPVEDNAQKMRFQQTMKDIMSFKEKPVILLSIDSPGGDPELIMNMVTLLNSYSGTKIAYIDNARYGGVFGPSCALAFCCDKIIKHPESSIGGKCLRRPLAFESCKQFPSSFIDEKNLDFWVNGVSIRESYNRDFISLAHQKGRNDPSLANCFCTGTSSSRSFDVGNSRSVPNSLHLDENFKTQSGADKGTTTESKLFDYKSPNYQIPLGEILGTKNYEEKKVVISSDLNKQMSRVITQAKSLVHELEDEDHGDTTRKLAAERRVKGLIGKLTNMIKLNPQIQYYSRDDLDAIFKRQNITYSSIDENWCLDGLASLQKECEQNINRLEERKKQEKKEKSDYEDKSDKKRKTVKYRTVN